MSYICADCGTVFAEPDKVLEPGAHWESSVCPDCGSFFYERAFACYLCASIIPESQDAFHLCKACEEKTADIFQKYLNSFTDEQLAFLNWKWEGIEFERRRSKP